MRHPTTPCHKLIYIRHQINSTVSDHVQINIFDTTLQSLFWCLYCVAYCVTPPGTSGLARRCTLIKKSTVLCLTSPACLLCLVVPCESLSGCGIRLWHKTVFCPVERNLSIIFDNDGCNLCCVSGRVGGVVGLCDLLGLSEREGFRD